MLVVFGFALLVITVAVVLLFAMVAELASRTPQAQPPESWALPTDKARLGAAPDTWPPGLSVGGREGWSVLLVLSTVCSSCRVVAAQLASQADWAGLGLVISAPNQRSGAEFVAEQRLEAVPHYIDVGGQWVAGSFGVEASPTALVFDHGRLVSAWSFNDVAALRSAINEVGTNSKQKEAV